MAALVVGVLLTQEWLPLGPQKGLMLNLLFVGGLIGGILGFFTLFQRFLYEPILRWCLDHKFAFLDLPTAILLFGGSAWLGFDKVFGVVPKTLSLVGVSESSSSAVASVASGNRRAAGTRQRVHAAAR